MSDDSLRPRSRLAPEPQLFADTPPEESPRPAPRPLPPAAEPAIPRPAPEPKRPLREPPAAPHRVVVTDLDIRFWSLVNLMVKAALAAIPAIFILVLFCFAAWTFLGALANPFVASRSNAANDAEKAADLKRYAAATVAADTVKKSIRDPDSLVFDTLLVSDDTKAICIRFRARNGFGGMTRESIVLVNHEETTDTNAWTKHCLGKMHDLAVLMH